MLTGIRRLVRGFIKSRSPGMLAFILVLASLGTSAIGLPGVLDDSLEDATKLSIAGGVLLIAVLVAPLLYLLTAALVFRPEPNRLLMAHFAMKNDVSPWYSAQYVFWSLLWSAGIAHIDEACRVFIEMDIYASADERFGDVIKKTRLHVRQIAQKQDRPCTAPIKNLFALTDGDSQDLCRTYFATLQQSYAPIADGAALDAFIVLADVDEGYVANLHLLDGLLSTYNERWDKVLPAFAHDVQQLNPLRSDPDFTKAQLYIFYCWLLWGPSIPVGTCTQWSSRGATSMLALQYGYGDESNSLPLIPLSDEAIADLNEILTASTTLAPAKRAAIHLRPRYFRENLEGMPSQLTKLSSLQLSQMRREDEGVLYLEHLNQIEGNVQNRNHAHYYSAYVWIMFIVMIKNGEGQFEPIHDERRWHNVVPFFEHGNVADDSTYTMHKEVLAAKAISGMQRLHDINPRVHFMYACAFDDANCHSCNQGGSTARNRTVDIVAKGCSSSVEKFVHLSMNDSAYQQNLSTVQKYNACHVGEVVHEFLDMM